MDGLQTGLKRRHVTMIALGGDRRRDRIDGVRRDLISGAA